jgi:hypothetical protein
MDFKTTKAEVTLKNINYALGLKSDIDVFTIVLDLKVEWSFEFIPKDWGIKAFDVTVNKIYAEIEWEIYKEDLDNYEVTSLLCKSDMFQTVTESSKYITGIYRVYGNMFNIVENLEVNGGILEIEEVVIDFMENVINIL